MAFNPALPAEGSTLDSGVIRSQLIALNADTQSRVTTGELNAAISDTSRNCRSVVTLNQNASSDYSVTQMQDVLSKIDELINALRR